MAYGLLQGLGQGMAQAGATAIKLTADEMKSERMAKYKLEAEERKAQREAAKTPANIRYDTDDSGNEIKVSENSAGHVLTTEQIRKEPSSSIGKLMEERERLASANPDDPRLAAYDAAIQKQGSHKQGSDSVLPSSVREWEYYSSLSKEEQSRYREMKRSQSVVDLGGSYGVFDAQSGGIQELEGGAKTLAPHQTPEHTASIEEAKITGKEAGNLEANRPAAETALAINTSGGDSVLDTLEGALQRVGPLTSGIPGKVTGVIPGTPAYDFKQDVTTIKANLGFDRLQAMRDSSPTGGALGQVSERELEYLQSTVANLDEGQSPAQLRKNIEKAKQHYLNWREIQQAHHAMRYPEGSGGQGVAAGGRRDDPLGAPTPPRSPAPLKALRDLYNNPELIDDFELKYGYRPDGL